MAVAAQWTLSDTVAGILSFSTSVVQAATTDNVQPLALAACEAFGATLAMSPETKLKVAKLCSRDFESVVLTFIKASVGYVKGDSGSHLSQSDAGNRFLGLAACLYLVEPFNLWQCAEMLVNLMVDSTGKDVLVPSPVSIHTLLKALKYRLTDAGFAASVLSWEEWLYKFGPPAAPHGIGQAHPRVRVSYPRSPAVPSTKTLEAIIKALSGIARIGEATNARRFLKIKVRARAAAWILAFLKWCLGEPPTIINSTGDCLLDVQSYLAIVELSTEAVTEKDDTQIFLCDELGSISDITFKAKANTPIHMSFSGLVTLEEYAAWSLRNCAWRFGQDAAKAMIELIPHACYKVYRGLKGPNLTREVVAQNTVLNLCQDLDSLDVRWAAVVPPEHFIEAVISKVFGIPSYKADSLFRSVSLVPEFFCKQILADLRTSLVGDGALRCNQSPHLKSSERCNYCQWIESLSNFVGVILLASFVQIDDQEQIMVSTCDRWEVSGRIFVATGQAFFFPESREPAFDEQIWSMDAAWQMLSGILVPDREKDCQSMLGISGSGQTLLYSSLENAEWKEHNFVIRCFRGALIRQGQIYQGLYPSGTSHSRNLRDGKHQDYYDAAMSYNDDFQKCSLRWTVSGDEKYLFLGLIYPPKLTELNLYHALLSCTKGLLVNCKHEMASRDPVWWDLSVAHESIQNLKHKGKGKDALVEPTVYVTDRNPALKLFCMGLAYDRQSKEPRPVVVAQRACIKCTFYFAVSQGITTIVY